MTKQDFELIAATLRQTHAALDELGELYEPTFRGIVLEFASSLRRTNPRFDRARFIAACMGEDSTDSAGRKGAVLSVKFELVITLGNDAMQNPRDVAEGLREVADSLEHYRHPDAGRIRDANGNAVGYWSVES